jgi:uncharacterized membrane protein YozB (DUF420 family)
LIFLLADFHWLVDLNACLNGASAVLLVLGIIFIRRKREGLHGLAMLGAYLVSAAFLVSYMAYHVWPIGAMSTRFSGTGVVRGVYLAILGSHSLLAATVPFLATAMIYLGWRNRRRAHRRLGRWTFPIWLYVSVTGVVIYLMLYHLYPPVT